MKHFNQILSTLGATDVKCVEETTDWHFWNATYHTPFKNITGSYLYLKHKCPLREASSKNLAKWKTLSQKQGYTVIVTPRSQLSNNLSNTKVTFGGNNAITSKQLLSDNFLKDFQPKPIQNQDYFIDPDLQLENGDIANDATSFLANWISGTGKSCKNTALAVLIADGGVGKTTVSRVLSQRLSKRDPTTIPILVESDQWRNLLQTTMTMDTIWDLAISRRFEHAGRLLANSTALRVLVREGLFAVIFDGFDELCIAPGCSFQPHDVVGELLQMLTPDDEIQQARIILTTRLTYWDSIYEEIDPSKLEVFRLRGFDNDQRKRYFYARLPDNRERDLAFRLSKQIGGGIYESIPKEDANKDRPSGVPFILDLIAQYVHGNPDVDMNPYQTDPLQNLLIDMCKRENRRQTLRIEPLKQFEIFEELFREFPNTFSLDDLKFYMECVAEVNDKSVVQRFTNHVFLSRFGSDGYGPKYEVLRVYFIARFLALGLVNTKGKTKRAEIAQLLAENRTGKTLVVDWLVDQLKRLGDKTNLTAIQHALDIVNDKQNYELKKASGMALFHIIMRLVPQQGKKEKMQAFAKYVKAKEESGKIIINDVVLTGIIKSIDYSNVEFRDCLFEGVDFRNCIFTKQTSFLHCSFYGTLEFKSCSGEADIIIRDQITSPEAEYTLNSLKKTGISEETKRIFAEDALSRALRKFKGDFGFNSIQYRYRKSGFKPGNPYNEKVWATLTHNGIIERHAISNVDEGGINIADDKNIRREIAFFYDNGVFGKKLQNVLLDLTKQ